MLKLFAFTCSVCQEEFDELVESAAEHPNCPGCGSPGNHRWVAPAIRTSDSRTYLDGTRPGWKDIKEWVKVDEAMDSVTDAKEKSKAEAEKTKILGV